MERRSIEAIAHALNQADVRFLVAGGMAVVAHGLVRFTADLDLILDPDTEALKRAIEALSTLGYGPRAPVAFATFADAGQRARWASEKGLTVFSLFSGAHKDTEVDLFLECPVDFDAAYSRALRTELPDGPTLTFVSLADLVELKRRAGRPRDLDDIAGLGSLHPGSEGRNG
jgi:hypothetical protein